jgi:hypothetical protein
MAKIIKGLHLTPVSINSGDINLAESSEKVISKRFPNIQWTRKDCRLIYTKKEIDTINKNYDFILLGPGGIFLLDDVNGKGIAELNKKSYSEIKNGYSGYQWIIKDDVLNAIKIPIIVFSVGWNQFRNEAILKEPLSTSVRKIIEKSAYFSIRHNGDISDLCNFTNASSEKIEMCFCPTIINAFSPATFNKKSKIIGFQIANDRASSRFSKSIKDRDLKFTEIQKTIEHFDSLGYEIHLIDQCVDFTFISWLKNKKAFKPTYKTVSIKALSTSAQNNYYSKLYALFATRGHAQMIPVALGVKVISIISHDKLKYFLEDIDASNTGVEFNELTFEKLLTAYTNSINLDWLSRLKTIVFPKFNESCLKIDKIINSI